MGDGACLELSAEPPGLIQSLTAFGCLIYWFSHTGDVIIPTRDILTACRCLLYWFTHTGDVIIPTKQTYNLPFKGVVKSTSSRSVEPGRLEKCMSIEKGGSGEGGAAYLSCWTTT